MPDCLPLTSLLAATESVHHRVTSALVDGFSQWWQMPLLVLALTAVAVFVLWMYRRDAAELPRGMGLLLAALRLGALAALVAAYLDFERKAEHEIVFPSRVAVLVDSSASMTLEDDPAAADAAQAATRTQRALEVLEGGGLLEALSARHEVSIWRFDADAEPLAVLPNGGRDAAAAEATAAAAASHPMRPPYRPVHAVRTGWPARHPSPGRA